ncbi:hypothetical protein B7494_g2388 [Chlorociboria aeruginascens]|nr:hypothetical protein B7494_g2388 [Chlorociboria aeruginascens]
MSKRSGHRIHNWTAQELSHFSRYFPCRQAQPPTKTLEEIAQEMNTDVANGDYPFVRVYTKKQILNRVISARRLLSWEDRPAALARSRVQARVAAANARFEEARREAVSRNVRARALSPPILRSSTARTRVRSSTARARDSNSRTPISRTRNARGSNVRASRLEDTIVEPAISTDENDVTRLQKLIEVQAEIRSLYLSGAPMFTREDIQDVSQQLRKLEGKSGTVFIRGINGAMVEFAVETGRVFPTRSETDYVLGAPFIHYCSFQELMSISSNPVPRIAWCSLKIYHYMNFQNKITKEIVNVIPTNSLEDTKVIFKSNKEMWDESEKCKQLISMIQSVNISVNIQQIVAFACGSIMNDSDVDQEAPRSSTQHALILTMRKILCKNQREQSGISCFAQDPAYDEVDKSILGEYGIDVLDDPEAFLKVDDSTLVISCAADVPVRQLTLELARPAAMLWDRIREHERSGLLLSDPDSSRIWNLILESYDVFEIPNDRQKFSDIVLYIRRPTDASTI